ncbi:shikimate dehydrogenase [Emcibacter sp.]|uniref:shikimate dehydrogenase n=1 Tax=Emcibacter sp. TaxID=1979954 RepID=UPI003A94F0DE
MKLTGKAKTAGVMGCPVGHSLSPRLHGYWLDLYKVDGAYVPFEVRPEDLGDSLRALPKLGIRGCNLTVPHKEAALEFMDEIDDHARRIGAVNTVVVDEKGKLVGRNTDGLGFLENILVGAEDWQPTAGPAVIVGAGGAARALVVALLDAGVPQIRLVNRTRERAELLARELSPEQITVVDWEKRNDCLEDTTLLVNSTTQGMKGQPALDISLDRLPERTLVNDIVYNPLITPLLAEARERGNMIVDGLGMLLYQAIPGFEAWFGIRPEVTEELRQRVLAGLV